MRTSDTFRHNDIFTPPKQVDPRLRTSPTYLESSIREKDMKVDSSFLIKEQIRVNNNHITSLSGKYGVEEKKIVKGKRITDKKFSLIFEAEGFKDKYSKKVNIPSRRQDHELDYFHHASEQMEKLIKFDKKVSCPQNQT